MNIITTQEVMIFKLNEIFIEEKSSGASNIDFYDLYDERSNPPSPTSSIATSYEGASVFSGTASSSGYRESRDERKVRQNGLPLSCSQIVDSSMEEFNDLLTQHTMTEEQISLCRDIRRRGKNKVNLNFLTFHIRMTLSGDICKNIASSSLHLLILWIV